MKAEELMIGDWVTITEPDDFHGYIGKVVITNAETNYIMVHIPNMHLHDVFVEDLQPVQLTKEILEENGFKHEQGYSSEVYRLDECFLVHYQDDIYWAVWLSENGDENMDKTFTYVHELQHIFKLLNIDKEIKL